MKLKDTAPWKKTYDKPRQHFKKQRHCFVNKDLFSQSYGFSSSNVWMWELDHKESWAPKNRYFWTVLLGMTLESPLDCKEVKPVNPKGDQSWIFIGRTDAEAEAPTLWQPDGKNWLWKRPWCWESLKASFLWCSAFFTVQLSHLYLTTGKTIVLTRWTFVGKVMALLLNVLSRFVLAFLPRSKLLLISWLQSSSSVILEPKKIKSVTVCIVSPSNCHEMMGLDAMILGFWMLSSKTTGI